MVAQQDVALLVTVQTCFLTPSLRLEVMPKKPKYVYTRALGSILWHIMSHGDKMTMCRRVEVKAGRLYAYQVTATTICGLCAMKYAFTQLPPPEQKGESVDA